MSFKFLGIPQTLALFGLILPLKPPVATIPTLWGPNSSRFRQTQAVTGPLPCYMLATATLERRSIKLIYQLTAAYLAYTSGRLYWLLSS